ncbi:hypothetical protein FEM48_Zijuj05G0120600 [Ziziphus jujuba var. spinosa]|uniref:Protein MIS12 homolog n=1 Tax=Ziziphus jujuba var. spinosa TaxID=714518 RepID=A0A978VEQ2_ZIZJJ|nr:hypothetical protein FEM48_Zijuj05G0120600 [Ziziphus jujuba var. spinosa]
MEETQSGAVFDSLNLNPQLFVNTVLNAVDDLVDDAFNDFYLQSGVGIIQKMVHSVMDKRLALWEKYCLAHCFDVPEGISLRKNNDSSADSSICQDALSSPDLDADLDSLRNKLTAVVKESAALNKELEALEHQTTFAALLNEAVELYEKNSFQGMLQEMTRTASELRTKLGKFKTRRLEETKHTNTEKLSAPKKDLSMMDYSRGNSSEQL